MQWYFNNREFQNITLFKIDSHETWCNKQIEDIYKDFIVSDENMARYSFPTAERLAVAVNHLIN